MITTFKSDKESQGATPDSHREPREAADLGQVVPSGDTAAHDSKGQSLTESPIDKTEATNATIADNVAKRYQHQLCYVRSTDKAQAIDRAAGWLQYKDGVWTREGAERSVIQAIEHTLRSMLADANKDPDTSRMRERTRDLFNALNRMSTIKQVASYYLDRSLREFNTDAHLLNVKNGTLDLEALDPKVTDRTLFREHHPEDSCSKQVQAKWEPSATADIWLTFLGEIFDGDQEVMAYVQRALGYTLLGYNPEHAMFLCYGGGGNGKSTLLDTITGLLGGYSGILSPDVLVSDYVRTGSALQPELTAHRDARLIVSSEPKKGVLNGHRLKSWTGDEHIQLRMMYGEPELMKVTFTLWLMTNVLPDLNEHSLAVERRMHVIPFMVSFVGREDLDLKAKLAAERDGILVWLIEGLRQWYEHGLHRPESIVQAAKDWYEGESLYSAIFAEVLTRGTSKDRIRLSELKDAMGEFIESHPEDFPRVYVNTKLVNNFIKSFGLTKRTVGGDVWVYGVKLGTDEWHLDPSDDPESDYSTKQKLYLSVQKLTEGSVGPRAVDLAEETGLSVKGIYVVLGRMLDEGILQKLEDRGYMVTTGNLDFEFHDGKMDECTRFLGELAWKLIREQAADQASDAVQVDAKNVERRLGLWHGDGERLLKCMVDGKILTLHKRVRDFEGHNTGEELTFTYHRAQVA